MTPPGETAAVTDAADGQLALELDMLDIDPEDRAAISPTPAPAGNVPVSTRTAGQGTA